MILKTLCIFITLCIGIDLDYLVVFTESYKVRETALLAFLSLKLSEKDSHR